ncbi:MAG: prolipoprotein diacylglyceryl transferase [Treponema sp.]|nr:prolipoprotein diacylglyceryl transferase [Treponema sp.]
MLPFVEVLGRDLGMYGIMALLGVFSCGIYASRMSKKRGETGGDIITFMLFIAIGIVVGSSFLYALVTAAGNWSLVRAAFANLDTIGLFSFLSFLFGGSVFYGGLLGGLAAAWICVKKNKAFANHIDIIAVCVPLFHFFGRIGCFLGGCCFGVECSFGFTFHDSPMAEANGVSRFPVQLLEAAFNLCLFFLLHVLLKRKMLANRLAHTYLLIYSVGRFFIEFLSGDDAHRGIWLFLSTSQIISLAILLAVLARWLALRGAAKKRAPA